MPYLDKKRQHILAGSDDYGDVIWLEEIKTAGELNYAFTMVVLSYLKQNGLQYQSINDVLGALEGAKLEFYRRVVAPYENKKIAENGDVFPVDLAPKV